MTVVALPMLAHQPAIHCQCHATLLSFVDLGLQKSMTTFNPIKDSFYDSHNPTTKQSSLPLMKHPSSIPPLSFISYCQGVNHGRRMGRSQLRGHRAFTMDDAKASNMTNNSVDVEAPAPPIQPQKLKHTSKPPNLCRV